MRASSTHHYIAIGAAALYLATTGLHTAPALPKSMLSAEHAANEEPRSESTLHKRKVQNMADMT